MGGIFQILRFLRHKKLQDLWYNFHCSSGWFKQCKGRSIPNLTLIPWVWRCLDPLKAEPQEVGNETPTGKVFGQRGYWGMNCPVGFLSSYFPQIPRCSGFAAAERGSAAEDLRLIRRWFPDWVSYIFLRFNVDIPKYPNIMSHISSRR